MNPLCDVYTSVRANESTVWCVHFSKGQWIPLCDVYTSVRANESTVWCVGITRIDDLLCNLLCKLVSYTHDYSIDLNVFISALNAIHYCIVTNSWHQLLKTSILVTELLVFQVNFYGSFTLSENKRESDFYFFNLCSCSIWTLNWILYGTI